MAAMIAPQVSLLKLQKLGYGYARGADAPLFLVLYGCTAYEAPAHCL